MKMIAVLLYNLSLLAGAAFLITQYDWSPWWMIGAAVMCIVKFGSEDKKETISAND